MKNRFLANTPLFAVLSDGERQALADRFTLERVADGATLFAQGDPAQAMYLVKSGVLRLVASPGEGGRVFATYGPSSVLGEVDLLLGRPHSANAVASGAADVWALRQADLAEAMAVHPAMSLKLSSFLGERVAELDGYLVARLRHVGVLAGLDDETLRALAGALTLRDVRRGALIFQAGTPAEHLYFVESGTVTIVSTTPDDAEPFRQLGPGEMFGHEALLRGRPYGAVGRATTDVQLWVLARAAWEQVAGAHPPLRAALDAFVSTHTMEPVDRAAARVALGRAPLFAGLPSSLLDAITERLTLRHAGTNETIYTAGDPGDAFYLIDRGTVRLLDGATLVEQKGEGDSFGELALLTGTPRGWTARTARPTNLWVLPKRDWDGIAVRHPELTGAVSRALAQRMAEEGRAEASGDVPLAMFPLFTGLTPKEQSDVARRLRRLSVAPGEAIFRRGAVPDAFFLVQQGQVQLLADEGSFPVRAGGFFGEMALLTGNPHTFTAQAVEPTELLLLDRPQFEAVLTRYPGVALTLSRALGARLEAVGTRGHALAARQEVPGAAGFRPVALLTDGMPPTTSTALVRVGSPSSAAAPLVRVRPRPARSRSPWAMFKLALVLLPLLWLIGVTVPTLLLDDAERNPTSPLHSLLQRSSPAAEE